MTDTPATRPVPSAAARVLFAAALAAATACSNGEELEVQGQSSLVKQGAAFTNEQRERDVEAGVETVSVTSSAVDPSAVPSDAGADGTGLGGVSIDPTRAAQAAVDPGLAAKDKLENLVTFRQLSLVGVDVEQFYDYLFTPDSEDAKKFQFPDAVRNLDGKDTTLVGYMIPLEYKPKSDDIAAFLLVGDLMTCCFGGTPRPDEMIYVEMEPDRAAKLHFYVPIVVRGKFKVGRLEDDFGLSAAVYSMTGRSVELFSLD